MKLDVIGRDLRGVAALGGCIGDEFGESRFIIDQQQPRPLHKGLHEG